MKRLTGKEEKGKYYIVEEKICIGTEQINPIRTWITGNENRGYGKPIDKLGQIEDLEEQIGCSLEVVFKALKGFYYKNDVGGITQAEKPITIVFDDISKTYYLESGDNEWTPYQNVPVSLYKKIWWLREDKSE